MRGEHSHKGFTRSMVDVFDKFSLKEFEEVKVAIEKLDLGEGSHKGCAINWREGSLLRLGDRGV